MEQAYYRSFWRGGEKIDLNGLKPDAVRVHPVCDGESGRWNLSFLRLSFLPNENVRV